MRNWSGIALIVVLCCAMAGDCPSNGGGFMIGGGEVGGSDRDFAAMPRLFISTDRASVAALDMPGDLEGIEVPAQVLKSEDGTLEDVESVAINSIGNLITMISPSTSSRTREIRVYGDAGDIDGEQTPVRTVAGEATRLSGSIGLLSMDMKLDKMRDILYVYIVREREEGEEGVRGDFREILVFEGTGTANFNGNIAPNRIIDLGEVSQVGFMAIDSANDVIYVAANQGRRIFAFDNASTLDGAPMPDRIIDNDAFGTTILGQGSQLQFQALAVDTNDTLYLYAENNALFIIKNASTLDSENAPVERIFPRTPADISFDNFTPHDVYVDGAGTGYILGGPALNPVPPNITVLVINDIRSAGDRANNNGGVDSDRSFQIDIDQFVRPESIRMAE